MANRPLTLNGARIVHRSTPLNDNPRQRERELCRMETAPLDTIGGWYAPAWAVGGGLGVIVCTTLLILSGAW